MYAIEDAIQWWFVSHIPLLLFTVFGGMFGGLQINAAGDTSSTEGFRDTTWLTGNLWFMAVGIAWCLGI